MPSITNTHRMTEVILSSKKKAGLTERKIPKTINATATEIESIVLSVRSSIIGGLFCVLSVMVLLELLVAFFFKKMGNSLCLVQSSAEYLRFLVLVQLHA